MTPPATLPASAAATFDARALWRTLVRNVTVAFAGTAAVLACLLVLAGRNDWWPGYVAATVASALAAGLSLIPLSYGLRRGYAGLVPAVMLAALVRGGVAVGGCMLAVVAARYPAVPTFVLMTPYYLALLAAETACITRPTQAAAPAFGTQKP